MGAAKKGQEAPAVHELIAEFQARYAEVLDDAAVSAEHTATPGWQRIYGQHIADDRRIREDLAERLREFADELAMLSVIASKKDLKPLADLKTEAQEHLAAVEAFKRDVLYPVKKCVADANALISKYRSQADSIGHKNPLHEAGLGRLMREHISSVPVPKFDETTGIVTLTNN